MSDIATKFHPVWVTNAQTSAMQGRSALRWGPPCATQREARDAGRTEVEAGRATISFVVREDADGARRPIPSGTWPNASRSIVERWESLWGECGGRDE